VSAPVHTPSRDFPVSLVKGTSPEVVGLSTLFDVLKEATTSAELKKSAKELREVSKRSASDYKSLKELQPGFVIGKWSYRSMENCLEYSSVMGFDLDALGDRTQEVLEALKKWEYTFAVFPSVSGEGLRLFVWTKATKERHNDFYKRLCAKISFVAKIDLSSKVKEGLRLAGFSAQEIKAQLKSRPHIDDVTSDPSRFWFYSGLERSEVFVNNDSKVFDIPKPVQKSNSYTYDWEPTEEQKVEYCVRQLEAGRIDITGGIKEWHKMGHALLDGLDSLTAEGFFMRICRFHPDFQEKESSKEWGRVKRKNKPGKTTIASFYRACQDYGVGIDWSDLRKEFGPTTPVKKAPKPVVEIPKTQDQLTELLEAERCVVATAIASPDYVEDIFGTVPKFGNFCFSDEGYSALFEAVELLRVDGMKVNPAAVALTASRKGDYQELIKRITSAPYYPSSVATNAKLVFDDYRRREIAALASEIMERASNGESVEEILSTSEANLNAVADTGQAKTLRHVSASSRDALERTFMLYNKRLAGEEILSGITTGDKGLDLVFGGRQKGHYYIKAARPAMGKTAQMLSEALAAARTGHSVGILSLEMPALELSNRLLANISGLPLTRINRGTLSASQMKELTRAQVDLSKLPIHIDDRGTQDGRYIRRQARYMRRKYGIDILFLDYIQLAATDTNSKDNTNKIVTDLSRSLKNTAKDEDIALVALCQLSRAVETRGGDKRPMLSDLRDSTILMKHHTQKRAAIEREYRKAKKQIHDEMIEDNGYIFCRGCGTTSWRISWSHRIPRSRRIDLIADKEKH
jgi:replicative DNA helicase